jgi:hypothetical protein
MSWPILYKLESPYLEQKKEAVCPPLFQLVIVLRVNSFDYFRLVTANEKR